MSRVECGCPWSESGHDFDHAQGQEKANRVSIDSCDKDNRVDGSGGSDNIQEKANNEQLQEGSILLA